MPKPSVERTAVVTDNSVHKTKKQQVIDLLSCENGATLEEMSTLVEGLPHSTRSFMTGLKKKGHVIESDKVGGMRRYRIVAKARA